MATIFSTRRQQKLPLTKDMAARLAQPLPTGEVLGQDGVNAASALARADVANRNSQAIGDTLRHRLGLPQTTFAQLEAGLSGTSIVDPIKTPADPRLIAKFGANLCLKHRVLPWRSVAGRVTILAATTQDFLRVRDALTVLFGPVHLAIATSENLDIAFSRACHNTLMENAEMRTGSNESCRDWNSGMAFRWGLAIVLTVLCCLTLWPQISFLVLCGWAVFALLANTLLKTAAAILHLFARPDPQVPARRPADQLPIVTILVPLFRERDIAGALIKRLSQLKYPTDRLDVCLVLEADDATTQEALAVTQLPFWMRAIKVPLGTLQTKPRALNYALCFAKGSIIGVYDAEDAPDPDQINIVVDRFAHCGPEVACLQGRLDFYNSHSNWLARCFTVEYATWFRIVLPGLERMGLVIPLGGTTLFFRREILEDLGGWDAHNVTEDADLGIRLARHGYRTEIINTVTQEEANARAWPWVKQRSRWLKGYAITYGVHMRNPLKLWKELGAWRFFGTQMLFAGTISQFLLAPLLWSFWLMLFGIPHPLDGVLSPSVALTFAAIFLLSEIIGVTVSAIAVTSAGKRDLIKWTPTLHLYFPLAALAAYKGVFELATKPFYWDKTSHGIFAPTQSKQGTDQTVNQLQPQPHPIAAE
ncbi:glycosyltransferase family 2 protein [Octadecabacter ascidiaceicola]|uniref:Beta-monoglucosyldiacylglycerol synthase n=1 Tax=Octadecabacter ascidiaceicola TaxID=1655543 RepID=A0A238JR07_9RHOB|nr:glycosyltransferase family 2 protein [Octadecabacter ascidiaceicola]SMX32995.1 Beta-monoglucosyldiacylglycerol synthase [Octadecabacter ascidiaceicola]